MLVAITGGDGAGKTTLSKLVQQALHRNGVNAVRLDRFDILNPQLSPSTTFVNADVLSVRQAVLRMPTPTARLLFMLWSMASTASHQLAEAGAADVVVYDSYWMKHTAAEIIFGADEQAALAAASLLPRADLTLYLKLTPEQLLERKLDDMVAYECGLDPACRPESFLSHQRRIKAYLDAWSGRFGWREIDGAQPRATLVEALTQRIEDARNALLTPAR